jgi:hypothetical protein
VLLAMAPVMPLAGSQVISLTILMARPQMKLLEGLQGYAYGQGYKQRLLWRGCKADGNGIGAADEATRNGISGMPLDSETVKMRLIVRRQVGREAVLLARMRVGLLVVAAGLPMGLQNTVAEAAEAAKLCR